VPPAAAGAPGSGGTPPRHSRAGNGGRGGGGDGGNGLPHVKCWNGASRPAPIAHVAGRQVLALPSPLGASAPPSKRHCNGADGKGGGKHVSRSSGGGRSPDLNRRARLPPTASFPGRRSSAAISLLPLHLARGSLSAITSNAISIRKNDCAP